VNPELPCELFTDASDQAIGAVLLQRNAEDPSVIYPICFASKKLTATQQAWSTTDKEALAVAWGLETFKRHFEGGAVIVYSDHRALSHITTASSPKLVRLGLKIAQYQPTIRYLEGDTNFLADWMSRSLGDDDALTNAVAVPQVLVAKLPLPHPELSLPPGTSSLGRPRKRLRQTRSSIS